MSSSAFICIFILCCQLVANAQQFTHTITNNDKSQVTVEFAYFPIRSSNFGVLVQQDDGNYTRYTPHSPRTYLGTVKGYSGAMASGLLKANGTLLCRISFEDGTEWSSTGGVAHVSESSWKPQWPSTLVPPTTSNSTIYVAEVGVDASYAAYAASGSDVNNTIDMVEFAILAANVPFLRDASIFHKLGKLVIRKSNGKDPYPSTDTGVLLNKVRDLWNGELAPIVGSTHHLGMVSRPGAGGGLAWVGTVATSKNAYSSNGGDSNGDFSVIWRHEAGHNWGSKHYEGGGNPEGPTIMSNNALSRFSSSELLTILHHKAKVPQLANASMVISRPPRANMDVITLSNQQPRSLDVLANDLDANFQSLNLTSVPNPTPMGSTTQISRSGSGLRAQIVYTPSVAASVAGDSFSYRIQNAQGKTSTGYVILTPDTLVGWWKLEESSGDTVKDSSIKATTGNITGTTSWDQGLNFEGASTVSLGTAPSLSGQTSFSLTVWVKVPSSSTSNAVLIQQRSPGSSTTDGVNGEYQLYLKDGARPSLMVFGDDNLQFDFSTATGVNDGQWHHIIALRDGSEGRIFIDGKLSASASNQFVRNLNGSIPVFLGSDHRNNVAFLTGTLSGVRIYSRALSADEISYLSTRPESLVGWWKMNEKSGSSLRDSSGNGASGTITGSTSWDQSGGLIFQGAGKVSFDAGASLTGKTSFSIHAWVKVPRTASSKGIIIQQRSPTGFNGEYQLYLKDGTKPALMVFGEGAQQFDFSTSNGINDEQWHHVIALRDGTEGRIYIDGRLSASASGQVKNLDGKIGVYMGWDSRENMAFLTASVKAVRIYNRAFVVTPQQSMLLLATT